MCTIVRNSKHKLVDTLSASITGSNLSGRSSTCRAAAVEAESLVELALALVSRPLNKSWLVFDVDLGASFDVSGCVDGHLQRCPINGVAAIDRWSEESVEVQNSARKHTRHLVEKKPSQPYICSQRK